jgi:hypothetical protein
MPKDPTTIRRANKHSTKATLRAVEDFPIPPLPERTGDQPEWHPLTLDYWNRIWASPMGPEYDDSDFHGLIALAELVDLFNYADSPSLKIKLASEIRQQRQAYGLTPMDRRRLQWTIDQGEAAEDRTTKRRNAKATATPAAPGAPDPREMLG